MAESIQDWGKRLAPWLANALCMVLIYLGTQLSNEVKELTRKNSEMREWQAEVKGSRWTARDHASYAELVSAEHIKLRSEMNSMNQQWLRDLGEIKIMIARIEKLEKSGQ